jgi:hypothetical protein
MPTPPIMRLQREMPKQELCKHWQEAIRERVKRAGDCPTPKSPSEFFIHHIGEDGLVAWAFNPGPGRTPAPGSLERLKAAAKAWAPMLEKDMWCQTIKEGREP